MNPGKRINLLFDYYVYDLILAYYRTLTIWWIPKYNPQYRRCTNLINMYLYMCYHPMFQSLIDLNIIATNFVLLMISPLTNIKVANFLVEAFNYPKWNISIYKYIDYHIIWCFSCCTNVLPHSNRVTHSHGTIVIWPLTGLPYTTTLKGERYQFMRLQWFQEFN